MKNLILQKKSILKLCAILLFGITALIIHSCKKDLKNQADLSDNILQAKTWYESTYPQSTNISTNNLTTQSTGNQNSKNDFTSLFKPDWQRNASYKRHNSDVIEMPVTLTSKFTFTLASNLKTFNKIILALHFCY